MLIIPEDYSFNSFLQITFSTIIINVIYVYTINHIHTHAHIQDTGFMCIVKTLYFNDIYALILLLAVKET